MRKNIFILIIITLLLTGCAGRYDLTINDNTYKESIILATNSSDELKSFNRKWEIPTNKDNYYLGDESTDFSSIGSIYKYNFNNNRLNFSYDFNKSDFINSTAVSLCYSTLSVTNYQGNTIISTNSKATCFDSYPNLTSLVINITVDKVVVNNNADKVSGNTYTWNLNRNNAKNKGINLTFISSEDKNEVIDNEVVYSKKDYTMYIISGIILIIALAIYFYFNKLKNNDNEMDD